MTHDITPTPEKPAKSGWRRARNFALVTALVIGSGLTGAYVSQNAFAQGFGGGMGPGFGPGFRHGGMFGGTFDPAQVENRADRMVRHLAVEIDATNEQQDKLRAVVKTTITDILPMREKAQAGRERARALLTQPTVNRADIEALRVEQMSLADAFSKRVAQAIGDASEILTPAQRQKIADHMAERRGYWMRWHRG
jgi:periplasmic protein CpxP/Spy